MFHFQLIRKDEMTAMIAKPRPLTRSLRQR